MINPIAFSPPEAAARIADGRLSAIALAEVMLARIAEREPVLRAFTHIEPALVLRQAARVDAAVKAGARLPLAGLFSNFTRSMPAILLFDGSYSSRNS